MKDPQISVLMAVYNGQEYLHPAIDGILGQSYRDFEFIICDDGSADATWQILQECAQADGRIRLLRNDENIGLARTLNRCLETARGSFIARQDADDISRPTRLAEQKAFLDRHGEIGLLSTLVDVIDTKGQIIDHIDHPCDDRTIQRLLLHRNCFIHGAAMFRRQCLAAVGGYNEGFPTTQDYELWLRIAEFYQVANLADRLYLYRRRDDSISRTRSQTQAHYHQLAVTLAARRRWAMVDRLSLAQRQSLQIFEAKCCTHFFAAGKRHLAELTWRRAFREQRLAPELAQILAWEFIAAAPQRYEALSAHDAALKLATETFQALAPIESLPAGFKRRVQGEIHLSAAFAAYDDGDRAQARHHLAWAIRYGSSWKDNRGAWALGLKSLLG